MAHGQVGINYTSWPNHLVRCAYCLSPTMGCSLGSLLGMLNSSGGKTPITILFLPTFDTVVFGPYPSLPCHSNSYWVSLIGKTHMIRDDSYWRQQSLWLISRTWLRMTYMTKGDSSPSVPRTIVMMTHLTHYHRWLPTLLYIQYHVVGRTLSNKLVNSLTALAHSLFLTAGRTCQQDWQFLLEYISLSLYTLPWGWDHPLSSLYHGRRASLIEPCVIELSETRNNTLKIWSMPTEHCSIIKTMSKKA